MNLRIYIAFLFFLVLFSIDETQAQNLPVSCVNGKVRYGISPLPGSTISWNVSGGTIIADYRDSVDVQWGNASGVQSISYRETNIFGCTSPEGTGYVILNAPYTDLGLSKSFCVGDSVILDAGNGFASYRWSTGSSNSSLDAYSAGIYWVDVTDADGCVFRDSVTVSTNTLPVVNLGADEELCDPRTIILDAGFWASYQWSKGSGNTSTLVAEEGDGSIWVKVTDEFGCVGTDTIQILQCIVLGDIPNAFTPNNDGDNDVWHIGRTDRHPNMVVKIYDRWGRLLFTSEKGYGKPWDGMSNGKQSPMDTYYYVIDFGDGTKERVGSVAIIR